MNDNQKYKVVFLGESAVGKTSIVQYIVNGTFGTLYDVNIAYILAHYIFGFH